MKWLSRLLGLSPDPADAPVAEAKPASPAKPSPASKPEEQAVLVQIDIRSLSEEEFERSEFDLLEDRIAEAAAAVGEFDGHGFGDGEVTIYLYGPDADALFRAIEPHLQAHPLGRGAKAVIRKGPPGAPEREVRISG
jgi:hypothetical protein